MIHTVMSGRRVIAGAVLRVGPRPTPHGSAAGARARVLAESSPIEESVARVEAK
jgi:hypothetical protein